MALGDVCKHERLARSCDECFMEAKLTAATERIATLEVRVEELVLAVKDIDTLCTHRTAERDTARRECGAMRNACEPVARAIGQGRKGHAPYPMRSIQMDEETCQGFIQALAAIDGEVAHIVDHADGRIEVDYTDTQTHHDGQDMEADDA